MATKPTIISDEAIKKATGEPWAYWYDVLIKNHAEEMPHKEIAGWLSEEQGVPPWWCQMLTVRFEQVIGRRKPGEIANGQYSVGVSVTRPGSMDDALSWWEKKVSSLSAFNEIDWADKPKQTKTDKWRYWKVKLADESPVFVNIYEKAPGKSGVQVAQEKLKDAEAVEQWRAYWKDFLQR